jgi:hypothetical protein
MFAIGPKRSHPKRAALHRAAIALVPVPVLLSRREGEALRFIADVTSSLSWGLVSSYGTTLMTESSVLLVGRALQRDGLGR